MLKHFPCCRRACLRLAPKPAAIFRALRWLGVCVFWLPLLLRANFLEQWTGRFQTLSGDLHYRQDLGEVTDFEKVWALDDGWLLEKATPVQRVRDPVRLWVKFDLPSVSTSRQVYVSSSPWERMELFFVRDGKLVVRQLTGTLVPPAERSIHVTMTPLFGHSGFGAVELAPGSQVTVYARLANSQKYRPFVWLRFYLWEGEQVLNGERRDRLLQGLYLGVILVLVIYNLGLYVTLRERSYLYYVLMEVGALVIWGNLYGLTSEFLWPGLPQLEYAALWLVTGPDLCAAIYFMRSYLDTPRFAPRSDKTLRLLAVAAVVVTPLGLAISRQHLLLGLQVLFAPALVCFWVAVVITIMAVRAGHPAARHFLLAISCSVAGAMTQLATYLDWLPANSFTLMAGQVGAAAMGIILSIGLGFRLRQMRGELADQRLAEAERQTAHERERRGLIETQSRELELKVRERTAELAAANAKVEGLLANILPQAIIEELKAKGITEPRRHEEVSILFTDFSGFTETVASVPAKRLVQELDEIFRAFDEIAVTHGLEKIKTIGDAYMAAAGLPVPAADHAARCVRAGLALTRYIAQRNQTSAIKWHLRVGVHSGAVVAGIVGKNKYAYDVWGDTVNLASRLESASERNRVNISAYTYDLVRDQFDCEYRQKLAAKGKGEIDMYLVRGEKAGSRTAAGS